MAISIDYSGAVYRIKIPQSYLTNVGGSLYELDTDQFWKDLKVLEAAETGIVFQDAQSYNPPYTVAGVTYAPKVEILNATNSSNTDVYEIFFDPDTLYSVRLVGSNNNIFDIQNAILANTTTQVIPTNSAGLQVVVQGSGVTAQDKADIAALSAEEVADYIIDPSNPVSIRDSLFAILATLTGVATGGGTTEITFRNHGDTADAVVMTVDENGNRSAVTITFP